MTTGDEFTGTVAALTGGRREQRAGRPGANRTGVESSHPDHRVAALAARQHGVVTRVQLLALGLSADGVDYRLKCGRLRRLLRGVYQVGPIRAALVMEMAAVLACGDFAWLSHRAAAVIWDMLERPRPGAPLDVTITHGRPGSTAFMRVHRSRTLQRDEVTTSSGIRVTTPARTLIDLAGVVRQRELEQALAQALAQRVVDPAVLRALVARHARLPGVAGLKSLLESGVNAVLVRSEAEERFLALVRRVKLRAPEVNVVYGGCEVDFLWRAERFAVEIDGYAFHGASTRFENDRRRDRKFAAAGLHVVRITWRQIVEEPEMVLVDVALALGRRAAAT